MSPGHIAAAARHETDTVIPADLEGEPAPVLPAGTLVGGRYRTLDVLGSGGYAVVYRARDEASDREVALKVLRSDRLSPVAARRLQREAQSAATAQHPALIPVHDHGTAPEGPYLVMELVAGETLRDRLRRGPLLVAEAVAIAIAVADALHALHAAGLVHRDLKPSNILLGADGRVRVGDLGLVTALAAESATQVTRADGLVGTMEYLSPEQALGHELDGRSDLYGLGLVLFEMLAGRTPFTSRSSLGSVLARVTEEPASLAATRPDAPAWIVAVVRRLLEREPARRYASAVDLADDLRHARATPGPAAEKASRARPRGLLRLGLGALALAAVAWAGARLPPRASAADRTMASAAVEGGVLRGKNARGEALWAFTFPAPLREESYRPDPGTSGEPLVIRRVRGRNEVWMVVRGANDAPGELVVLDDAGRLRLRRRPGRGVTFGSQRYDRFAAGTLHPITDRAGRQRLYLAAAHVPWFPGVVEELDEDGRPRAEFWSVGHAMAVSRVEVQGREMLAIGAHHNATRGGSLALFDLDGTGGHMPAEEAEYRCADCGEATPVQAYLFPASDALAARSFGRGTARVDTVVGGPEGRIEVSVDHGSSTFGPDAGPAGQVHYSLDVPANRVRQVAPSATLLDLHAALFAAGRLDHAFGPGDERALARVRRWDGARFVELPYSP